MWFPLFCALRFCLDSRASSQILVSAVTSIFCSFTYPLFFYRPFGQSSSSLEVVAYFVVSHFVNVLRTPYIYATFYYYPVRHLSISLGSLDTFFYKWGFVFFFSFFSFFFFALAILRKSGGFDGRFWQVSLAHMWLIALNGTETGLETMQKQINICVSSIYCSFRRFCPFSIYSP